MDGDPRRCGGYCHPTTTGGRYGAPTGTRAVGRRPVSADGLCGGSGQPRRDRRRSPPCAVRPRWPRPVPERRGKTPPPPFRPDHLWTFGSATLARSDLVGAPRHSYGSRRNRPRALLRPVRRPRPRRCAHRWGRLHRPRCLDSRRPAPPSRQPSARKHARSARDRAGFTAPWFSVVDSFDARWAPRRSPTDRARHQASG